MADITITVANIELSGTSRQSGLVQFGEAGTAGQAFYLDSTTNKHHLALNDTEEHAAIVGILVTPKVSLDGYGILSTEGDITIGGALSQGQVYAASDTPGGIAPDTDTGSGEFVTIIGTAQDAAILTIGINATGAAHV